MLLASVVLKREWHVGASTTERLGCSIPGGAAPLILPDTFSSF